MYAKTWRMSTWTGAHEIAGYWHGLSESVRVYKDGDKWACRVEYPWAIRQEGWEPVNGTPE